jgi:hypothetical protein
MKRLQSSGIRKRTMAEMVGGVRPVEWAGDEFSCGGSECA